MSDASKRTWAFVSANSYARLQAKSQSQVWLQQNLTLRHMAAYRTAPYVPALAHDATLCVSRRRGVSGVIGVQMLTMLGLHQAHPDVEVPSNSAYWQIRRRFRTA